MQQPTRLISTPFAQEGEKTEIQNVTGEFDNSATYRLGFPPLTMQSIRLGGKPPKGTDFNGVLFDITENISFLCKGGRYQYNAGLSTLMGGYPEGSNLLLDDNVTEVVSTVAGNQNNPNINMTGWTFKPNRTTAEYVLDASGKTQQEINDSAFRVNAKLLGIVPFLDATAQLEHYLNDSVTHEIYLPKGEYILSRKITINSIHPKKIVLEQGAYFKPDTAAGVVLFDIYSHLGFENLSFDFDGKGCFTAVRYNPNCGIVRLRNTTFKNLKDVDSTRASTLLSVSAVGNFLDIDGVYFDNCLKRGNGSITDSAGSLNGLYIHGTTNLLGGKVDNIDVKNFHNINASDQIIIEDTAGLYVATGGLSIPLTVGKVTGTEFGKRLVKLQSSDVSIDYIDGISDTGDSWSVVGVLSEPNTFTGYRNRIGYVKARGNMDYAVADLCQDTEIGTADIEVYGSNPLNTGTIHAGLFVSDGSSGLKVTKLISKASRPISLNPASVAGSVGNINITLAELTVIGAGTTAINIPGNASLTKGSINGLTIDKLILTNAGSSNIALMSTFTSDLGYSDFDFKDIEIRAKLINNRISLGFFQGVNNLYIPKVKYIDEVGQVTTIADFITAQNCKNVKIDNVDLPITSNRTFYVVNSSDVTIGPNMKLADATTGHVVNVGSTNVKVQSQDLKITDATNAGEIIRFSGTTAQRPKRAQAGFNYFDTTISKLITCSTSAIIDAAGNVTAPAVWSEVMMTKQASFSYDPPSIPAGESAQTFQTFSGVTIGTPVIAAFSVYDPGVEVSAVVSAANTVRINFKNIGTVPLDLGSGTITVKQI